VKQLASLLLCLLCLVSPAASVVQAVIDTTDRPQPLSVKVIQTPTSLLAAPVCFRLSYKSCCCAPTRGALP